MSKIRAAYDGSGNIEIYKATSKDAVFPTDYENASAGVGYSSQTGMTLNTNSSTNNLRIASTPGGTEYYDGKIGYVKIARKFGSGAGEFAFDGIGNDGQGQPPVTQIQNLGSSITGEQQIGENRSTQDSSGNYDVLSQSRQDRSKVDNRKQNIIYKSDSLTNTGNNLALKLTQNRESDENQARFDGLVFQYNE